MRAGGFASVAVGVAALTLSGRIVGFGRWLVFSKTVGDTCLGDVYNAANQLPNVLFEIVAGGVLAGVVIPVVARHVGARRSQAASQTTSALLTWTLLALTPAAVLAFLGAQLYADAFVAASCPGGVAAGAALLQMFVPQIWLYGLAVVTAGILQAHHKFLAAAVAPLASSLVVIAAYLLFDATAGQHDRQQVGTLARSALGALGWGTTLGVAVLALCTVVPISRLGLRLRPRLRFAAGDTGVIARIGAASVAGLVLQQLTVLVIIWVAKQTQDPGSLTRFTWANAIYLLPFAVLVAPLLQIAFPRLSAAAEFGQHEVNKVLAAIAPACCLLSCLGGSLLIATAVPVARVFVLGPGSGRTEALAWVIIALAPAVVGFSLMGLASRTLLATRMSRAAGATTVVAWVSAMAGVLAAHLLLPGRWVVVGIGGSLSIGMLVGAALGWLLLARAQPKVVPGQAVKWEMAREPTMARSLLLAAPIGLLSGAVVWLVSRTLTEAAGVIAVLGAFGAAAGCTVLFVGAFFIVDRPLLRSIWALRNREAQAHGST